MLMRDVKHQERAQRMLQRALASRRMPHAYLFAGPEGVGKEMLAAGLAQTLLCERGGGGEPGLLHGMEGRATEGGTGADACGQCGECRMVEAGTHPDLQIIYRQLNRQHPDSKIRQQKALFVTVDVIRQFLVDKAGTCPVRGRAKIFIVREAERMNDAAQNCLLKTLEEPPRSTFIILVTSALEKMLPTTRSRCQPVHFAALPDTFVIDRLRQLCPDAPAGELEYAGRRSGGSLGAALRQVEEGVFRLKQPWGERLVQLARGGRGFAPHALAKPFAEDAKVLAKFVSDRDPDVSDTDATRAGLQTLLGMLGDFYLDALRQATGATLAPINADQGDIVAQLARQSPAALARALGEVSEAEANLVRNANIELTLESLFISLAGAGTAAILV